MKTRTMIRPREWATLILLIAAQCGLILWEAPRPTHVDGVPLLRVAAPRMERVSTTISPYGPGFEHELLALFAEGQGYVLEMVEVQTPVEAWDALHSGEVDLVVGVGGVEPESLESPVVAGPVYATSRPVLVHSTKRYTLRTEQDMCENPILTTEQHYLTDSLQEEGQGLDCEPWTDKVEGVRVSPVLDTLNEDRARFALVDDWSYSLWQPFFLGVKPAKSMGREVSYRWFWRSANSELHADLSRFWEEREGDNTLAALHEKYFGFLPEDVDYYDVQSLTRALQSALPRYHQTILKHGRKNGIDPLLLTAVIYQESRFVADATSKTGVRGLMQLTQNTARILGVDRLDPVQAIDGGARYLKMLWDAFEPMELEPWDRWFFTLASYNQGLGHVYDAIALSKSMGGTGSTWHELKKVLPLLAWQKYYSQTKHGYTRGYEAVAFVESIRYYYYIMHGLVSLSRPEAEYLGPLVSAIPVGWPAVI